MPIADLASATTNANSFEAAFGVIVYPTAFAQLRPNGDAQICETIRCVFGNPFHPSAIQRSWLRWHDATVPKIAQKIYADRSFADLPILADALEEAGCDNLDILTHCRSGGEHVRGCWVVDLILDKT